MTSAPTSPRGDWVPALPAGWAKARLRWLASIYAGGTPDRENLEYWEDGTVPWINSGAVNQHLIERPSTHITEAAYRSSSARWIPKGALVMALAGQGRTKGMVAQLAIDTTCNQSMAAIVPSAELSARFAYWWLTANYQNLRNLAGGDLRDGLNLQLVGDVFVPLPGADEQRAIADFLDRETAQIDAMVDAQERLVALLEERRRAAITQAVTRGLHEDAELSDASMDWMGRTPAHWEVAQIKWLTPVRRGASPRPIDDPKYFDEEGEWSWVRIADVTASGGRLRSTTQRLSPLGSSLSVRLEPGSLFVSIAATVGLPCITEIRACIHDGFVYFPHLPLEPMWLYRIFESGECFKGLGKMGTQLNLNTDTVGSIRIPIPPRDEMEEILAHLESVTARTDGMVAKARESVALMKERRAALISAAVTGRIDVRTGIEQVERELEEARA